MKSYKTFDDPSDIISARRTELSMTQSEIAKKLGYQNVNFISMVESKRSKVPLEKTIEIARALEIDDTNWFIEKVMRQRFPEVAAHLFG